MEIIEKQVEKLKEVPYGNCDYDYGHKYSKKDINSKANAGLTLGIIGTALGAWTLFGNSGRSGFGLRQPELGSANININGMGEGRSSSPTVFETWNKECVDNLNLQKGLYEWAIANQNQRFEDRSTVESELFRLYNSQITSDFSLYRSQRDSNDSLRQEINDLKTQVAINSAVRPYQDKLIQCEIDKAFTAGINYVDKKTCNVLYGQVVLPSKPQVSGYPGIEPCCK